MPTTKLMDSLKFFDSIQMLHTSFTRSAAADLEFKKFIKAFFWDG